MTEDAKCSARKDSIHNDNSRKYALDVKRLAECGILTDDISRYLAISKEELLRDYSDIITKSYIDRTVEVANVVYKLAIQEEHFQAAVFWLKNIGKWEQFETQVQEIEKSEILTDININIGTTKADFMRNEDKDEN